MPQQQETVATESQWTPTPMSYRTSSEHAESTGPSYTYTVRVDVAQAGARNNTTRYQSTLEDDKPYTHTTTTTTKTTTTKTTTTATTATAATREFYAPPPHQEAADEEEAAAGYGIYYNLFQPAGAKQEAALVYTNWTTTINARPRSEDEAATLKRRVSQDDIAFFDALVGGRDPGPATAQTQHVVEDEKEAARRSREVLERAASERRQDELVAARTDVAFWDMLMRDST